MTVEIRFVRHGDEPSLREHCFPGDRIEYLRGWVETIAQDAARGWVAPLVAVDADVVVACLTVRRSQDGPRSHRASLHGFVIAPHHRGGGLARRLVDAAGRWSTARGCTLLEVTCRGGTRAEGAYHGLGFTEYGRLPGGFVDADGGTVDEVYLYRPLP